MRRKRALAVVAVVTLALAVLLLVLSVSHVRGREGELADQEVTAPEQQRAASDE